MTEVTAEVVAASFTSGMHAARGDAGSASAENDAEVRAAAPTSQSSDQIVESSSDRDQDDYIVTYCMCLHEPSCARAEPVRNTEDSSSTSVH